MSDLSIVEKKLDTPINIELAIQGKDVPREQFNSEIISNVTISIPGSQIPVVIRNFRICVTEFEMNVILIGRDVLDVIGFNFETYFKESYE